MRVLLDAHALLWWITDDSRLTREARAVVADSETFVAVSAATVWELAIKRALGRLTLPDDFEDALDREGFSSVPVTVAHALVAGSLPPHHKDPFDRMLVAQAQLEGLTVVTRDARIAVYGVATLTA